MYNADISAVGGEASARGDYGVHMCTYVLSNHICCPHICTCVYTCMYIYIYTYVYMQIYKWLYVWRRHLSSWWWSKHTQRSRCVYIDRCVVCMYVHVYIYVYMFTYIHMYICIYIHDSTCNANNSAVGGEASTCGARGDHGTHMHICIVYTHVLYANVCMFRYTHTYTYIWIYT